MYPMKKGSEGPAFTLCFHSHACLGRQTHRDEALRGAGAGEGEDGEGSLNGYSFCFERRHVPEVDSADRTLCVQLMPLNGTLGTAEMASFCN